MHSVQVSSIDTWGDASPGTLPSRDAACSEVCQHCWSCRHLCWAIALADGLANEIPVSLTTFRCCQDQKHSAHLRIHGVAAPVECDCLHSQRCRRSGIPNHRSLVVSRCHQSSDYKSCPQTGKRMDDCQAPNTCPRAYLQVICKSSAESLRSWGMRAAFRMSSVTCENVRSYSRRTLPACLSRK